MESIKKLKKNLTILFTCLTGIILTAALLATWYILRSQYTAQVTSVYHTSFTTLCETIASAAVLKDSWLSMEETSLSCLIYIEDNGKPLHFSGAYSPSTPRSALIKLVKDNFLPNESVGCYLTGTEQDTYYCMHSVVLMPDKTSDGSTIELWVLFDHTWATAFLTRLTRVFCLFWAGGCLLLYLISRLMVHIAVKPTLHAMRRQNEFIASASHELKSPLTVIRANLGELDHSALPAESASLLTGVEKEITRMQHLTEGLLRLAGSDAGISKATLKEVALDTLLIELYEIYEPITRKSGHPFRLLLPDHELPSILADEELLKELLGIFLNNAIAYSGKDAPIELAAERVGRHIFLAVIDHGVGISDEEKRLVFDRFYRGDKSRTEKNHFGLGLSIAKEIAALHRASLQIKDTEGGGATFAVEIRI